jgi:purine-nucleoside phosphorylase
MYEGLDARQVVEPAMMMGRLGASVLVLTNAAGGVDPGFEAGTLMLVTDHLNLTGRSPLSGPNDDTLGPRFLDLTEVYDPELRRRVRAAAGAEGVALAEGVYAGLLGPTYETPAEVRMLGLLGAHAVGMSTVMEAIGARYVGMRVVAVSLVTNKGAGLSATLLTHDEVLEVANEAGPRLARVLARFVRELPGDV